MYLSNLELTGLGIIFAFFVILFIRLKVIKDWLKSDNDVLRQNLSDSRLALRNERKIWQDKTDNLIEKVHEWKQKANRIIPINKNEPPIIQTSNPVRIFKASALHYKQNKSIKNKREILMELIRNALPAVKEERTSISPDVDNVEWTLGIVDFNSDK